jgi:hypothetical protein
MFGHHDDDHPTENQPETTAVAEDQSSGAPVEQTPAPVDDTPASSFNDSDDSDQSPSPTDDTPPADTSTDTPAPTDTWQHPGTPLNSDKSSINDIISPAGGFPKRPTYQYPQGAPPPVGDDHADAPAANPELIDVRNHALDELEPLLDKLNLPPEDKFRAIMMILQAKDDESLVKKAYEVAHAIEDEEVKARALYDIVNEVNYFTQPPEPTA